MPQCIATTAGARILNSLSLLNLLLRLFCQATISRSMADVHDSDIGRTSAYIQAYVQLQHTGRPSLLRLLDLLRELRNSLKEVRNEPNVRNLEYRRIWVLVHSNNKLALLHAREMLNGTTDPQCGIKLRCHDLKSANCLMAHVTRVRAGRHRVEFRAGLTLPVWPTWSELSAYPASTAAREAPTAAPSASASGSMILSKFSFDLSARPPETTREADDRSGREDWVSSSLRNLVVAVCQP